ncbi:hypothetical protein ALC53_00192 [Atta colombica]|uniref:Uncharacterized protein n=1 Tax=Atta colombica TaxID=520822 RepID=A0A195BZA1_9HYME|nr:hypothetical protein ALC53_00192 [Atta colombica]
MDEAKEVIYGEEGFEDQLINRERGMQRQWEDCKIHKARYNERYKKSIRKITVIGKIRKSLVMPYNLRSCESIRGVATRQEKIGSVFAASPPPPSPEKRAVHMYCAYVEIIYTGCFKIRARKIEETGFLFIIKILLGSQMHVVIDVKFIFPINLLISSRRDALITANRVKGEEEDGFVPEPLEEAECTRGVCALP